ncbi:MAG: beta-N-acetylhexosaminidase [Bacteroidota bacterium]
MQTRITHLLLLSVFALAVSSCRKSASPDATAAFNRVVPAPVSSKANGGAFFLTKESTIGTLGGDATVANYLAGLLRPATGFDFPVKENDLEAAIVLELVQDTAYAAEGYRLSIGSKQVKISAAKPAGLFYGVQTLRQILPDAIESTEVQSREWEIATGEITDKPVWGWRGSMLDVARHFFGMDVVKRYIDLLALYKMNVLHLHLSDDQGWRIEIKSWPNLALHGGTTEVGGDKGGYFTQEQYKELIAYAAARFITIVPEIDMPGHTNSALASYGELNGGTIVPEEGRINIPANSPVLLGGKPRPTELYTGTEVGFSTLRIEKESTKRFINDVVRELAEITPSPYIHIGGDEAHVTKKEDYIAFVSLFSEVVRKNGKVMIGWEEIAQGNIDANAIALHWANPDYAKMAAEKGARIIMSPSTRVYLDMQYDSLTRLGLHWAAYIEADRSYTWDPGSQVDGVDASSIVGVEAPLWSETIDSMDDIEYLLFPRITAVAEVGWTPAAGRSFDGYKGRIAAHGPRWKQMGIDYYPSALIPWK